MLGSTAVRRALWGSRLVHGLRPFAGLRAGLHGSAAAAQQAPSQEETPMTELIRDFLAPKDFYDLLVKNDFEFFTGVPDSLLKDFCAYVTANAPADKHIISANEGSSVALAAGYHLATGKPGVVYLQNSGLGNTVNPLMSLADPKVYSIPMLLLIGWRGEPGKKDEPQHLVQGQTTPGLLGSLHIPFQVLPDFIEGAELAVQSARHHMELHKGPFAFLVRRQTFLPFKLPGDAPRFALNREEATKLIVDNLSERDIVVSTTGMLSRELFEYRVAKQQGHDRDFLTVGSMGHASGIATGIALSKPDRTVYCLDGDGAVIMHMGNLATVGQLALPNLKHIVINNGAHDSVGGQPTCALADNFSIPAVAKGCGYRDAWVADTPDDIVAGLRKLRASPGPALLEVRVNKGSRKNLGRPTRTPLQNKADFMKFVSS